MKRYSNNFMIRRAISVILKEGKRARFTESEHLCFLAWAVWAEKYIKFLASCEEGKILAKNINKISTQERNNAVFDSIKTITAWAVEVEFLQLSGEEINSFKLNRVLAESLFFSCGVRRAMIFKKQQLIDIAKIKQ